MAKQPSSFMNWLGRQIGHVTRAAKSPPPPQVVYKKTTVQETSLADRPDEKLRRTVIDEVVRKPPAEGQ